MHSINTADNVDRLRMCVIDRLRDDNRGILRTPYKHRAYIESTAHMVARQNNINYTTEDVQAVVQDLLGYGPINPLIYKNDNVTEVQISSHDKVYIEEDGILLPTGVRFRNEKHLRTLAEKIALTTNRRLDESNPFVDTKLPDGTRVSITIPPISVNGTTISLRRFPKPYTMEELVESGTMGSEAYAYTNEIIKNGLNVAATGSMSAGKTTLINGLIWLVGKVHGSHTSVVSYEDTAELQPQHENIRQFEARPPNIEGKGEISIKYLAQSQMLRTRADWIILGESRGPEAFYIVVMMNTGHSAMTSFHSNNAEDAVLYRMPSMIVMSDEGKAEGRESALSRTASALDTIYHCAKVKEGDRVVRRVVQIAEVLRKRLPGGSEIPEVHEVFRREGDKLIQVADTKIFQKHGRWH